MAEGQGRFFPEQGNRQQPTRGMQERGGTRFDITAPPRPGSGRGGVLAPPREKELAPPPTPEEISAANAGELLGKKENAILGFVKKHPVVTTGATLAAIAGGVAAVEAYQGNIPGVHRSVDIPQSFDTSAIEGVIGDNNILRGVSLETIQNAPQFDENGNPLFFMATPKQGGVSHFEKKLVAPGILPEDLEQAKEKNVKDKWRQDVATNTNIPMPLDGYVFSIVVDREGKPAFGGTTVLFMTPNNTLDFVNITTDDNRRELLINAPMVSKENGFGKDYQKGLFVRRGEPLFRPLVDTSLDYMRQSGERGSLASRRIPGDIFPLTLIDPTTGERKLPAQ